MSEEKLNDDDMFALEFMFNRYLHYRANELAIMEAPDYSYILKKTEEKYQKIFDKIRLLLEKANC